MCLLLPSGYFIRICQGGKTDAKISVQKRSKKQAESSTVIRTTYGTWDVNKKQNRARNYFNGGEGT
jgi:hypothetical protein